MGLGNRLAVFLLFATNFLSSQTVLHTTHDTTQKQQDVKVTVINPHGKQPITYSGHAMPSDSVQQGVKINPFNFARGEFALYYEARISDAFSVEAAGGVTYTDYMYELFNNGGNYAGPIYWRLGVSGDLYRRHPARVASKRHKR